MEPIDIYHRLEQRGHAAEFDAQMRDNSCHGIYDFNPSMYQPAPDCVPTRACEHSAHAAAVGVPASVPVAEAATTPGLEGLMVAIPLKNAPRAAQENGLDLRKLVSAPPVHHTVVDFSQTSYSEWYTTRHAELRSRFEDAGHDESKVNRLVEKELDVEALCTLGDGPDTAAEIVLQNAHTAWLFICTHNERGSRAVHHKISRQELVALDAYEWFDKLRVYNSMAVLVVALELLLRALDPDEPIGDFVPALSRTALGRDVWFIPNIEKKIWYSYYNCLARFGVDVHIFYANAACGALARNGHLLRHGDNELVMLPGQDYSSSSSALHIVPVRTGNPVFARDFDLFFYVEFLRKTIFRKTPRPVEYTVLQRPEDRVPVGYLDSTHHNVARMFFLFLSENGLGPDDFSDDFSEALRNKGVAEPHGHISIPFDRSNVLWNEMCSWFVSGGAEESGVAFFDQLARLGVGNVQYTLSGLYMFLWQFSSAIHKHYTSYTMLRLPRHESLRNELAALMLTKPTRCAEQKFPSVRDLPQYYRPPMKLESRSREEHG